MAQPRGWLLFLWALGHVIPLHAADFNLSPPPPPVDPAALVLTCTPAPDWSNGLLGGPGGFLPPPGPLAVLPLPMAAGPVISGALSVSTVVTSLKGFGHPTAFFTRDLAVDIDQDISPGIHFHGAINMENRVGPDGLGTEYRGPE